MRYGRFWGTQKFCASRGLRKYSAVGASEYPSSTSFAARMLSSPGVL